MKRNIKAGKIYFMVIFALICLMFLVGADAQAQFSEQKVIISYPSSTDVPISVFSADLDGDGDMDVISASENDDKISWYANDGAGSFGAQQVISTSADGARSVYACDLDGDGDMDVLSASLNDP